MEPAFELDPHSSRLDFAAEPLNTATATMDFRQFITLEPDKRSGQPCIRNTRMAVHDVLDYLASGMTVDELLHDFPYLTRDDVRACLAYAAARERAA
jgi:uncharacterized protein (DUF433 family)